MGKLEGKNAVVTGGGRGVGRAISLAFAQEGRKCHCQLCRKPEGSRRSGCGMIQAMGRKAVAVKGDVGQEADAIKVVEACVENFGSVHISALTMQVFRNPAMLHKLSVATLG